MSCSCLSKTLRVFLMRVVVTYVVNTCSQSFLKRYTSSSAAQNSLQEEFSRNFSVPLTSPIIQIWGSNTDIGKTLISAGIFKQACSQGNVSTAKAAPVCTAPLVRGGWKCLCTNSMISQIVAASTEVNLPVNLCELCRHFF